MTLVQLSFAYPQVGGGGCQAPYPNALSGWPECLGNSWMDQSIRRLTGFNARGEFWTGDQRSLDDCFDYSELHQTMSILGLGGGDDFTSNDDCPRIFGSDACPNGMWVNGGFDSNGWGNIERYSCYCYQSKGDCGSSEVAVGDEDQKSLEDLIQQLKHEGDQNAALMQAAMQKLAAEGSEHAAPPTEKAVAYKSENDALKKANKVLLNTLQKLAKN